MFGRSTVKLIRLGLPVFVLISGQDPMTIGRNATDFLYRFCTADPAFGPFSVFLLFGESITYMFSTLLHSSIPTSSTILNL